MVLRRRRRMVPSAAGITLLLVTAAPVTAQPVPRTAAATDRDLSQTLAATTRVVTPAVVEIFATSYAPGDGVVARSADLVSTQRASGSGVIVDADGYIITNAHVVRGAQRVRVELSVPADGRSILRTRGRSVTGQIVGVDVETDLAVVKIEERNLPTLTFGDSDELSAGQLVLAFGSPLGLNNSVSLGVISSVARQLEPESPMIYVQTDASINPGSSGGPLVDVRGRLVGINTLIVSQTGGNDGLSFAAPSNIVRAVYDQIRKFGRVRRGEIGIRAQTITPELATGLLLPRNSGVILADVIPGSPAAQAGIRPGDIVLALDGKAMENGRQLHVNLYRRLIGDVIALDVLRDGQTLKVAVAMTERHDPFSSLQSADPRQNLVPRLGILGVDLDPRIATMLPVLRVKSGVVVASTAARGIDAREGGLAAGDVVYAVNRKPVATVAELRTALDQLKSGDAVVLHLERRGELLFLAFTVE
ncbi:MAG TPA: trypsin-like peptidase domain-containing protein [Vicinamibacterales bacterium]|nr:trypsin-like peptidase domain-containing protein [Vicinamibacterales bacterium]